ncbi:MAG: polyprenyl synthetase family protein [Neisseriales bacterium]|nr:MAG: polyprenyl synthetase family protein [Neisseriales bacterium]
MQDVDRIITEQLRSEIPLIAQTAEHVIQAGGKRLRPLVTLLSGIVLACQEPELVKMAAMVECIHTATLLHDDVIDNSSLRRGQASANTLFGNAASVLVGDFLYSRAFQMMVSTDNLRILKALSNATILIAEGEMMQMANIGNMAMDETTYLLIIQKKTAQLFETAAQIGAIVGKADSSIEQSLMSYGIHLGTAFQLMDDVLDYVGDPNITGKKLGSDLAEGKLTLPLIFLISQNDASTTNIAQQALFDQNKSHFNHVRRIMEQSGALRYATDKAKAMSKKAMDAIQHLPNGLAKTALVQLAHFAYARNA